MHEWDGGLLDAAQRDFVLSHLVKPELISDMSWGQVDTRVLRVTDGRREFVVKAAGRGNHHIGREISAHQNATAPLLSRGWCSQLIAADRTRNVLITTYLSGNLAQGSPAETSAHLHEQAGAALRTFHDQTPRMDDGYESRVTAEALARLNQDHRIKPDTTERAREILTGYSPQPILVVPTHGDWQPRNWLIDSDRLRVIDFGRFGYRPAATDLCRLAMQQWLARPDLEAAFFAGYGADPRDPEVWHADLLREAVGTAVWAHNVGDVAFESQGHQMLDAAIARFS